MKSLTLPSRRFRDNLVVQGEPRIRNFAGAPLVASNGHRLGTLCFLGPQPRIITAEEATILANMAGGLLSQLLLPELIAAHCKLHCLAESSEW